MLKVSAACNFFSALHARTATPFDGFQAQVVALKAQKNSVNAAWKHSHCRESNTPWICVILTNIRERLNLPLSSLWSYRSANSLEMPTHESKLASSLQPISRVISQQMRWEIYGLALWKQRSYRLREEDDSRWGITCSPRELVQTQAVGRSASGNDRSSLVQSEDRALEP